MAIERKRGGQRELGEVEGFVPFGEVAKAGAEWGVGSCVRVEEILLLENNLI